MTAEGAAPAAGHPKWLIPVLIAGGVVIVGLLLFILLSGDDASADDGDRHNETTAENLSTYQADLQAVGCWSGDTSGDLSTKTEAAIREFQEASGLDVDGQLSDETKEELQKAASDGTTVCAGNDDSSRDTDEASVTELEVWQHDLNVVGCWAGPVDGRLGPETEAAIRAFQQAANLPVDGQLTKATEDALASNAAQGAIICTTPGHRHDGRHSGGGSTTTTTARPTTTTTAATTSSTSSTSTSTSSTTTPADDYQVLSGDPFEERSDAETRLADIEALDITGFQVQQTSGGEFQVLDPGPMSKADADDLAEQLTSNGIPGAAVKIADSPSGSTTSTTAG